MKAESRRVVNVVLLASSVALVYGIFLYNLIPYINEHLNAKKLVNVILVSTIAAPLLVSWVIYNKTIKKWKFIGNNFKLESSITITMIFFFFSSIALITAVKYAK